MFYEVLYTNCIFILMHSFNKNILQNNVFARSMRNIVCFCKNIFNNHNFNILYIV